MRFWVIVAPLCKPQFGLVFQRSDLSFVLSHQSSLLHLWRCRLLCLPQTKLVNQAIPRVLPLFLNVYVSLEDVCQVFALVFNVLQGFILGFYENFQGFNMFFYVIYFVVFFQNSGACELLTGFADRNFQNFNLEREYLQRVKQAPRRQKFSALKPRVRSR